MCMHFAPRTRFEIWLADMHVSSGFTSNFGDVIAAMANHSACVLTHDEHSGFDFQVSFFVSRDRAWLWVRAAWPAATLGTASAVVSPLCWLVRVPGIWLSWLK
jgi:hypothetical protein